MRMVAALSVVLLAGLAAAEDTPASLLADVIRAIEEGDVATAARIMDEEGMTKEELDQETAEENKKVDGHFFDILKARPEVTKPVDGVRELSIAWTWASAEKKLYRGEARLERQDGTWRLDRLSVDVEEDAQAGEPGEAKEPPSQALARFVEALKKKDGKALLECCPPEQRTELTPEKVLEQVTGCEEEAGGHLVEGVEGAALIASAGPQVVRVEVEIEKDVADGELGAELALTKRAGAWWIGDMEVDLQKKEGEK